MVYFSRWTSGLNSCEEDGVSDMFQVRESAQERTNLPPRRREDICGLEGKIQLSTPEDTRESTKRTLVPVVPATLNHLSRMRLHEERLISYPRKDRGQRAERTSSFSILASCVNRMSSCTSKLNIGPDLPRYLLTIKSSATERRNQF